MWWFRTLALLITLVGPIAGCGFRPMYGHNDGNEVLEHLGAIEIAPMRGLLGNEMYNQLLDNLGPRGNGSVPRYRLVMQLETSREALITEADSQIRRFKLAVTASYTLKLIVSDRALHSGRARAIASYNVVETNNYGSSVAEEEANLRGIRQISEQIVAALSLLFKRPEFKSR